MSSDLPERRIPGDHLDVPGALKRPKPLQVRVAVYSAIIRSFRVQNSILFKVSEPGRQYLGDQHDFALLEQFVDGLLDFPGYIHNASRLSDGRRYFTCFYCGQI